MKRLITLSGLPLTPTRNAMNGVHRNNPHQANAIKQQYQASVRERVIAQLPDDWEIIDRPVFIAAVVNYGKVKSLTTKGYTDPSRCDADNAFVMKLALDAISCDSRKRFPGTLLGRTLRTKNKVKLADIPDTLYTTEGDPVPVLLATPVNPALGKQGQILKRAYHHDLTLGGSNSLADGKLWYPDPDQSHAVIADDKRSIVPLNPVIIQREVKSTNPRMAMIIYDLDNIDPGGMGDLMLAFIESL